METIIIGKPAMNVYLPLQEFPQEGDLFRISSKNESLGNVAATSACLLAKWGIKNHFTGVLGNDLYAEKLRDTLKSFGVDTKYLETDFTRSTSVNYIVLNMKSGVATKVLFNDPEMQVQKYKYDFVPQFGIIDATDFAGAHALLNNNATCKTVFYARVGDRETIAMSKRCTYVVCTQSFAESLTKEQTDGTAHSLVQFYQKIVDVAGTSNYIVVLNNHKILYSQDGKVKMLPEMKIDPVDYSSFDSIFVGALSFSLINNLEIDDAIKFANTAAAISLTKIGEVPSIPEIDEVLDNSGLREKLGVAKTSANASATAEAPAPLDPSHEITMPSYSAETSVTPASGDLAAVQNTDVAFGGQVGVVESQAAPVNPAVMETSVAPMNSVPMEQQIPPVAAPTAPAAPIPPIMQQTVSQVPQNVAPMPQVNQMPASAPVETNMFDQNPNV